MVVERGEIWWAELDEPRGSSRGFRRPVLIVQSDAFNQSRIATIIAVILTSNVRLAEAPGNVFLPRRATVLAKDSVANVSQVVTVDRDALRERVGRLDARAISSVDAGLRLVLGL